MAENAAAEADAVAGLAVLLAAIAQSADGRRDRELWTGLVRIAESHEGADSRDAGTVRAELAALREAPDDQERARALARTLLAWADRDPAFAAEFRHWREQKQIVAIEHTLRQHRQASAAGPAGAGSAPETRPASVSAATAGPAGAGSAPETRPASAAEAAGPRWELSDLLQAPVGILTLGAAFLALKWPLFQVVSILTLIVAGTALWYRRTQGQPWGDKKVVATGSLCIIAVIVLAVTFWPQAAAPHPGSHGDKASVAEDLQVHAEWCCRFTSVVAGRGFYWPGTAASLPTSGGTISALTPAGLGVIEIPVQTSATEPIDVAAPKVIVRSRTPNLTHGVVAIVPPSFPQGSGSPAQYEADVDNPVPVSVLFGSADNRSSSYEYVSSSSTEVITLFVADSRYDCVFDIQLTYLEQGRTHNVLLTNGGRHFRILGSAGLPWYEDGLPVSGHPFSYYAPGNV